jgi:hypothetical protein
MNGALRWPSLIAASGFVLGALVLGDLDGPLRVVAALWFLLVCTGMAFVPLLEVRPLSSELALGVVLSILVDTLAALALLLAGVLTQTSGLIALLALSLIGCGLQVLLLAPSKRPASETG